MAIDSDESDDFDDSDNSGNSDNSDNSDDSDNSNDSDDSDLQSCLFLRGRLPPFNSPTKPHMDDGRSCKLTDGDMKNI